MERVAMMQLTKSSCRVACHFSSRTIHFWIVIVWMAGFNKLFSQVYTTTDEVNHVEPISSPIAGPISLSVSGDVLNSFTGTSAFSVPILPGLALNHSGANMAMETALENRDAASSWVGSGWSLQMGRFVVNPHATKDITDDDWFFIEPSGLSTRMVKDNAGVYRLVSHPHWKVALSFGPSGDKVVGITVTQDDGSIYCYGDFQDGVGSKAANRTAFVWGSHITDYSTNAGSSPIVYSWDLSQVKDAHGIALLDISYFQEQESIQMNDGARTYTRASYVQYIQNLRTGQKIEFCRSTKGQNEWQPVEAPARLQSYETMYLSEIHVFPTASSITPILRYTFSYDVINSNSSTRAKRLLRSIKEYDQNSVSLPSLDFTYDASRGYCLQRIDQPSGGSTILSSDQPQYTYLNQESDGACTLVSGNPALPQDANTIMHASATTVAEFDRTSGILTIKKWLGQWNTFQYTVGTMILGTSNENDGLMVSDEHVGITYQESGSGAMHFQLFDWHPENVSWQLSLVDVQYSVRLAAAMAPSGSMVAEYQAGGSNPIVCAWKWSPATRSWSLVGSYVETNIGSFAGQWPLRCFQANDDCILYDTPTGMFLRQAFISGGGNSFPLITYDTVLPDSKYYILNDRYVGFFQLYWQQPSPMHTGAVILRHSSATGYISAEYQALPDIQYDYTPNYRHSYPIFAPERILYCEYDENVNPINVNIHVYKWNGYYFDGHELIWQRPGPGAPYYSDKVWNICCQISNDWVFVLQNNTSYASQPYEARVWGYRYNSSSRTYTSYPLTYFTYSASDDSWSVFCGARALLTDQHLIITCKGRDSWYNSSPPQYGFTDVFSLDRENPSMWPSGNCRIFSQHDPTTSVNDLFAGINMVGVHSIQSGELKARLFHGVDRSWANAVRTTRVTAAQDNDGNGLIRTKSYSYGTPTFDLTMVSPGYSTFHSSLSGSGSNTTYFNNDLSVPLTRGVPYLSTLETEGTGSVVQTDSTYWRVQTCPSSALLFELWKTRESHALDGIVHAIDYEYASSNGLVRRTFDHVGCPSELSGNRDVLTRISYGFEHSTSMTNANMLSQADRVSHFAIAQTHTTLPAQLTTSAQGTTIVDDKQFSVNFPQTVTWSADCYQGTFYIGSFPGGNDIVSVDGSTQIPYGSFAVEADVVYYVESAIGGVTRPSGGIAPMLPSKHSIGTVTYDAGGFDPVLISSDSTVYDPGTLYRTSSLRWNGSGWITTESIISRDCYGQIQESQNIDGVRTTTLYGYNSSVPIASVANSAKSQIVVSIFDDGDVTPWSGYYGTWAVQNGCYRQTSTSDYNLWTSPRVNTSASGSDGVFEADVRFDNAGSYRYAAVAKVVSSPYLETLFELRKSESTAAIYSCQGPINSAYASASFTFTENTWYHLKGEIQGTTARLYVNGQLLVTLTSPYVAIGSGKIGLATYYTAASFDNVRMYPLGAIATSMTYDPQTLQESARTDANLVTTYYLRDGFARVTGTKNDDRRILESQSNYFSRDGHGGTYVGSDPNFTTKVSYVTPDGHCNFTSSSGWSVNGNINFNVPLAGETTVQVGTYSGEWDYFYKPAGQGNVVSRVDFYPDNTTAGTPHVLVFDGAGDRFAVQFDPGTLTFRMQTGIGGVWTLPHTFGLSVVRNQWYTVEIEKDSLGRCYAWVGRKGEGRNYADMYSVGGYQPTWSPNIGAFSNASYYYLANFYLGSFAQSTSYSDGLGRTIQTQTRDGVGDLVSTFEFDNQGRRYRTWRMYRYLTNYAYDNASSAHAISVFGIPNPYTQQTYQSDPLSRLNSEQPIGRVTSNEDVLYAYGSATLENGLPYQYSEARLMPSSLKPWMVSRRYLDKLGRVVRSSSYASGIAGDTLTSTVQYNFLNKPLVACAPKGDSTNCSYDFLGRLSRRNNADDGTTKYIYDNAGRLRFMIDSTGLLANPNKVLYWKYDSFGRAIEDGYITSVAWGDGSILQGYANSNPGFPTTPATWRKKYAYDYGSNGSGNQIDRLWSVLTNNNDNNTAEVEEYFTYDRFGNAITVSQKVIDFSATTSYVTTYGYDLLGRNTEIVYPSSPNGTVDVQYMFDQAGRVKTVNSAGGAAFAAYTFGPDGQMNSEQLNLGGPVSKTRTLSFDSKGRPISIACDLFTETMTYDAGGYNSVETFYHGLMASATSTFYIGGPTPQTYALAYDNFGRLTVASNSIAAMNVGVGSPTTYDKNGNIQSIKRGTASPFSYTYYIGKNRVQTRTTGTEYSYDATGNLVSSSPKGLTLAYDPFTELAMTIISSSVRDSLEYGGNKQRVLKKVYSVGSGATVSTVYLHGNNEYPLVEKSSTGTERTYVYGPTGLLAMRDGITWYYVAKDHLGSTRVVFNTSGAASSTYDFDSYGSLGRSVINANIPYRYTGQEYDFESLLHNFRARLYDSELGMFYATDPAHKQNSPYGYCSNNPVIIVDRDGRFGWLLIPLFIGCVIGDNHALAEGKTGWDRYWSIFSSGAISVTSALAGYGFGAWGMGWAQGLGWSTAAQSISAGAIGGAASGGTNSLLNGENVAEGLSSGFVSGGLGAGVGIGLQSMNMGSVLGTGANVLAGGFEGGIVNSAMGGNFSSGFRTGLVGSFVGELTGALARLSERLKAIKDQILAREPQYPENLAPWTSTRNERPLTQTEEEVEKSYADNYVDEIALRGRYLNEKFDAGYNSLRIDDLHVRFDDLHGRFDVMTYHLDWHGLVTNPIGHIVVDLMKYDLGLPIPDFIK